MAWLLDGLTVQKATAHHPVPVVQVRVGDLDLPEELLTPLPIASIAKGNHLDRSVPETGCSLQ